MTVTGVVDPVEEFNVLNALKAWHARGFETEELLTILYRDLQHCRTHQQPSSAINIERMLEALEA